MAISYVLYPAETGATTDYAVPFEYLSEDYVKATVDGVSAPFTFVSTYLIRFTDAPVGELKIYRETGVAPLNSYANGSVLLDDEINESFLQALHIATEAREAGSDADLLAATSAAEAAATAAQTARTGAETAETNAETAQAAAQAAQAAAEIARDEAVAASGVYDPMADQITAATEDTSPADADIWAYVDATVLRRLTWANIKAALKTYFDTFYQPVDAVLTNTTASFTTADETKLDAVGTMANRTLTISTSDPSGGTDGDVWFKVV